MWTEVWEAVAPSTEHAAALYAKEIVAGISDAIDNSAWAVKRQGAAAVTRFVQAFKRDTSSSALLPSAGGAAGAAHTGAVNSIAATLAVPWAADALLPMPLLNAAATCGKHATTTAAVCGCLLQHASVLAPQPLPGLAQHVPSLAPKLLAAIPGRAWEGKEDMVQALAQLAAHVPRAFPPSCAALDAAANSNGARATSIDTVIRMLVQQTARSSASLAFRTTAARGLVGVLLAHPAVNSYDAVATALIPALRSFKAAFDLDGGASKCLLAPDDAPQAGQTVAGSGSRGPALVGGRLDEAKEGEARGAAKSQAEEESAFVAACYAALAAALPAAVLPAEAAPVSCTLSVAPGSSIDGGTPLADGSGATTVLPLPVQTAQRDPPDAALLAQVLEGYGFDAAGLSDVLFVRRTATLTQAAHLPRYCAAALAAALTATRWQDRCELWRCVAVAVAKWLPDDSTASTDRGSGGACVQEEEVAVAPMRALASSIVVAAAKAANQEDRFPMARVAALQVASVLLQRLKACPGGASAGATPADSVAAGAGRSIEGAAKSALEEAARKLLTVADARVTAAARALVALF